MTISRISSGAAGTNTISLGTHAQHDMIVAFGYRDSSITPPTVPAGWRRIRSLGANANSMVCAVKWAAGSSETFGTWTNANQVAYAVYRSNTYLMTFGGTNSQASASTTTWTYPALGSNTVMFAEGISWVIGVLGIGDYASAITAAPNSFTAPTNMTNVTTANDGTSAIAIHDTNAAVTSWAATNVVGSTSSKYVSHTIEVTESGILIPSGGSSGVIGGPNMRAGMAA